MHKLIGLLLALLILPLCYAETAQEIAIKDLRSLYAKQGIYAGAHQFSDYWVRDALFASLGANAIGNYNISETFLNLLISYQKKSGQLPMRIGDYDITLKLLGLKINQAQKPRYVQDKLFSNPRDQNCLFVIAAENYVLASGDINFARKNFKSFEMAVRWLAETDNNNNFLVEEGKYAGWTDSVKKKGEVLYTNVCYYRALKSLSNLANLTNQPAKAQLYALWAKLVRAKINEEFWLEQGYYADWINGKTKYTYFSTDGNLLAIFWGVADKNQTREILSYIDSAGVSQGFGIKTAHPNYALSLISPINIVAGIKDYHTNLRWLWLSCIYAKVLNDNNSHARAEEELNEIKHKIEECGTIYEVYEPNGKPVSRMFYKSEQPFAWSSGVCLWVLENWKNN